MSYLSGNGNVQSLPDIKHEGMGKVKGATLLAMQLNLPTNPARVFVRAFISLYGR